MAMGENNSHGRRIKSFWLVLSNAVLLVIAIIQWSASNEFQLSTQEITLKSRQGEPENTMYGHIHMAKTAGSTVNGELAVRYERICGHKGYSYDALRINRPRDSFSRYKQFFSRGRVPLDIMAEIGYEDCDLFSTEEPWETWVSRFGSWHFPMELHLPCRDPIDHLLSQCNMRDLEYDCNATNVTAMTNRCVMTMNRFSKDLLKTFPVKCYNAMNIQGYLSYMDRRLQKRKIVGTYTFRSTNRARQKEKECLLRRPDLQKMVKDYLVETYDYYSFCVNDCMGSEQELPLVPYNLTR